MLGVYGLLSSCALSYRVLLVLTDWCFCFPSKKIELKNNNNKISTESRKRKLTSRERAPMSRESELMMPRESAPMSRESELMMPRESVSTSRESASTQSSMAELKTDEKTITGRSKGKESIVCCVHWHSYLCIYIRVCIYSSLDDSASASWSDDDRSSQAPASSRATTRFDEYEYDRLEFHVKKERIYGDDAGLDLDNRHQGRQRQEPDSAPLPSNTTRRFDERPGSRLQFRQTEKPNSSSRPPSFRFR